MVIEHSDRAMPVDVCHEDSIEGYYPESELSPPPLTRSSTASTDEVHEPEEQGHSWVASRFCEEPRYMHVTKWTQSRSGLRLPTIAKDSISEGPDSDEIAIIVQEPSLELPSDIHGVHFNNADEEFSVFPSQVESDSDSIGPIIYDEPESYFEDESEESSPIEEVPGGRRRALLIAVNYANNPRIRTLRGPHTDVEEVKKLLEDNYRWPSKCITTLKDDNRPLKIQPTLINIRRELRRLVEGAQSGDHFFFYFTGHGTQVKDEDGDELDGKDEVLVASDGGRLIDDELHDILVRPLPTGCHLTAVFDCCTSGTGLDLPFGRCSSTITRVQEVSRIRKNSLGDVVLLAACEDSARAYEKRDDDLRVRGLLTLALINTLRTCKRRTYEELLSSIRKQIVKKGYTQKPQLSCSHEINLNDYFDLSM